MKQQIFTLVSVICLAAGVPAIAAPSPTEPFDRIVLKDMTVIKASLVKDMGDSLAYFELGDIEFVKHMVGRDQVFKWVHTTAAPAKAIPALDTAVAHASAPVPQQTESRAIPTPDTMRPKEPVEPSKADDTVAENFPVVDYLVIMAKLDSTERANARPTPTEQPAASEPKPQPAPVPEPAAATAARDTAVPNGLARVRFDPPTVTTGVKLMPRSGMVAINIIPSITSLALGLRQWYGKGFGWGAQGAILWGSASGFTVNYELMRALNSVGRVRWYFFPKIGYQWTTITTQEINMLGTHVPSISMDLSFMSFVLGLGLEWRSGINRNHGWAIEAGYQGGSANYTIKSYTIAGYTVPETKSTYSPSPVFLGFSYAYYF